MDKEPRLGFWIHLAELRGEFTLFRVLGGTVGAISLLNLWHTVIDFGLSQVFMDVLTYYEFFTAFLFGWIDYIAPFAVPQTVKDLWVLSFLGVGLEYKSNLRVGPSWVMVDATDEPSLGITLMHSLLFHFRRVAHGFLMLGITYFWAAVYFTWTLRPSQRRKMFGENYMDITFLPAPEETPFDTIEINRIRFLKEAGRTVIILLIFFSINAYAPSV